MPCLSKQNYQSSGTVKSDVYCVVAVCDTVLYANGRSWDVVSTVVAGDMFLVQGCAQDFGGWRMLRVLDGGALQADCRAGPDRWEELESAALAPGVWRFIVEMILATLGLSGGT